MYKKYSRNTAVIYNTTQLEKACQFIQILCLTIAEISFLIYWSLNETNIAGRLPENSHTSFVDLQLLHKDVIFLSRFCSRYCCFYYMTLSLSIKVKKSQFQSEEVIFDGEVSHMSNKI